MTVIIGSKWLPGNRVIKDYSTGEFQEVNPRMNSETELVLQAALLNPLKWTPEVTAWLRMHANEAHEEDYQRSVLAGYNSMRIKE